MINDLISREALMQFLIRRDHYDRENGSEEFISGIETVLEYAESLPAVDAAPVVHGRWIPNIREETRAYPPYTYQNGFKCSLCGRVTRSDKEPYCHCGAKMDKEE